MGIYYCAIDLQRGKKFESPNHFSIKNPGLCHPTNPFPGMFIMMNMYGYNFELINDAGNEDLFYSDRFEDITNEVYKRYIELWPFAKDEIYEPKKD